MMLLLLYSKASAWEISYIMVITDKTETAVVNINHTMGSKSHLSCAFYLRPVLAFQYCRCLHLSFCVCLCVLSITSFSAWYFVTRTNLDHKCKTLWFRPIVLGLIDLDVHGEVELKSQNLCHFVHKIIHHRLKLGLPDLDQKCISALFKSLFTFGFHWPCLSILFLVSKLIFLPNWVSLIYLHCFCIYLVR